MEIETERLVLREFKWDDWPEVLAYQSDPRYQRFYPPTVRSAGQAQAFVRMFLEQQQEEPRRKFQLAAVLKSSSKLIGNCGLRMETIDAQLADLGYEFSPEYWGQGYAAEAARAMIHVGFCTLHLHRIWSWCIAENHGSTKVFEKLGMQYEGRLRENEFFRDRWWDTLMYGMLESEWKAQKIDR